MDKLIVFRISLDHFGSPDFLKKPAVSCITKNLVIN